MEKEECEKMRAREMEFLMILDPIIYYYKVSGDVSLAYIFKTFLRVVALEAKKERLQQRTIC